MIVMKIKAVCLSICNLLLAEPQRHAHSIATSLVNFYKGDENVTMYLSVSCYWENEMAVIHG